MRIFISTGEPSGDLHAANLVLALKRRRPGVEVVGFGGPRMAEAGATVLYPLVDLAVMWFLRVLLNVHKFLGVVKQAEREFIEHRPDVVVLIDYPGLHWIIARRAKKHGIPVVYFVPPQIWAWAGWRVKKVRRFFDLVLCSLPFEPAWYHARGVPQAEFVGHPYFDELADRVLDPAVLSTLEEAPGRLVAILPGSRSQEIERNLPMMLRAASQVAATRADTRFVVSCHREKHVERVWEMIRKGGHESLPLEVVFGRTPEVIRVADLAWSVSGSVSLELMAETLPTVIVYKLNRIDMVVARPFIKSKYITLVNLLAEAEVMPEYLTTVDVSGELASWAMSWLDDPAMRARTVRALSELRDRVAQPGATERAAGRILGLIDDRAATTPTRSAIPGPHQVVGRTVSRT
jgi:lipid-A-disaccharide synthase